MCLLLLLLRNDASGPPGVALLSAVLPGIDFVGHWDKEGFFESGSFCALGGVRESHGDGVAPLGARRHLTRVGDR